MLWWVLWWVRVKHPFVYRNSLSWQPGLKLNYYQTRNHWYWQSLIFLFTSRGLIYVIFQDPICLMWYWPTTPHLRSGSHHEPTLAFSRYKELLGHKSREQIEMSLYTCSVSGRPLFIIFMVSNTNQDWRQRQETACHYWHVSCLPAR